jgi:surface polysaccharide O-acyltransferase-like enzyme
MVEPSAPISHGDSSGPKRDALPKRPDYLASMDAARLLAVVGVIWIHAAIDVFPPLGKESGLAGRFAVPFFTQAAVFFAFIGIHRCPERRFGGYLVSRFARIYLPFMVWTIIYLSLKILESVALGKPLGVDWSLSLLWKGGAYHLWFLPFILAATLAVFPVARMSGRGRSLRLAAGFWTLLGISVALPLGFLNEASDLAIAWKALPSVFWGIALGCLYSLEKGEVFRGKGFAWLGFSLLLAGTVAL